MSAGPGTLHIHIDGASRGNPGEAGFGIHVTAEDGREQASLYGYLGRATNNVAEYPALPLHREAKALMSRFADAKLTHVRREQNREADRLANRALDEKASKLE